MNTQQRTKACIVGTALACCFWTAASAQDLGWTRYSDSVEGCRIEYPAALFTQEPFDAAKYLQRFSSTDGRSSFGVKGVDNSDGLSALEVKAKYLAADIPGNVTYERTKDRFVVMSGHRDDDIYYTKVSLSADQRKLCIFEITYPRSDKKRFDAIITRMSHSFQAAPRRVEEFARDLD